MSSPTAGGPGPGGLTVDDILDLRAYERVRDDFRRRVMERKRRRRVPVGPIMTLLFENVDTVRFQVQEMARVEKIATDEGIQGELDVYNRLLPTPGELSATLFIELTSEADLRHWLPRLVGIERALAVELGSTAQAVWSVPEEAHGQALSREEITPAVHYVRFRFSEAQVARFASGPSALVARHPEYEARTELGEATRADLLADLGGEGEPLPLG
ncbi:MAG TPA: DUF3501 family protein [Acidimicrobiales bacterium]|nr:DUF3501 family protein [Acidimicrobiales bacterium]